MPSKKQNPKLQIFDLQSNIFYETARAIKLGLTNLWRNRLLSLATILVMAIMICIFNTILIVNLISKQALNNLNQKVDIILYLKEGTDYYNANLLASKIQELSGVKKVEYISKEKALDIISKTYPETTEFLNKFNLNNPLPASLSITTENAETHQIINNFIKTTPLNQYIDSNKQNNRTDTQSILSDTSENLININNFVKQLIFWIVFIFIIGGTLIIINAIQLTIFTRRNEIFIMRLVGATPNFIRLPFLTEGLSYAIISLSVSFLLLYLTGQALGLENLQLIKENTHINILNIFFAELGLAILLSTISSLIAVQKYLQGQLNYN